MGLARGRSGVGLGGSHERHCWCRVDHPSSVLHALNAATQAAASSNRLIYGPRAKCPGTVPRRGRLAGVPLWQAARVIKTAALLKGVRVLLFDVMGTVVDVDGTARRAAIAALGFALTPEQAAGAVEDWNRGIDARISDVVAGRARVGRVAGSCSRSGGVGNPASRCGDPPAGRRSTGGGRDHRDGVPAGRGLRPPARLRGRPGRHVARGRTERKHRRVGIRPRPTPWRSCPAICRWSRPRPATPGCAAAPPGEAEGDERSQDQIMADTMVEWLIGQTRAEDLDIEVQITMPFDSLLDPNPPDTPDSPDTESADPTAPTGRGSGESGRLRAAAARSGPGDHPDQSGPQVVAPPVTAPTGS